MPRIAAASIDAHVRQQTARIVAAARELFRSQGYRRTDMHDIAAAVGLARNSLYRYFSNKDYILLACIEEDMAPYLDTLRGLEQAFPDPLDRIDAWLTAQFDIATGPAHVTMEFMAEVREGSEELKRRIAELHTAPTVVLEAAVREMPEFRRNAELYAAMIGGMVLAATRVALQGNRKDYPAVHAELRSAVHGLLST